MSNKDYLEKIRKAREKSLHDYNMTCNDLAGSSEFDTERIATALEIIAETLIKIKEHKEVRTVVTGSKPNIDVSVDKFGKVVY